MNGKLIARIEREFVRYAEILCEKLHRGDLNTERFIKLAYKLEDWRDRFDDLIFAEVSE
jgi:hypothetical protein